MYFCGNPESRNQTRYSNLTEPSTLVATIRFSSELADDNSQVTGFYRIGNREAGAFHFMKVSRPTPSFELSIAVEGQQLGEGTLLCEVPHTIKLDRAFVFATIAEIMGGEVQWYLKSSS